MDIIGSVEKAAKTLIDQDIKISDHQQSWGYEDGPWKGPGPPLLVPLIFIFFLISVLSDLLVLMAT